MQHFIVIYSEMIISVDPIDQFGLLYFVLNQNSTEEKQARFC